MSFLEVHVVSLTSYFFLKRGLRIHKPWDEDLFKLKTRMLPCSPLVVNCQKKPSLYIQDVTVTLACYRGREHHVFSYDTIFLYCIFYCWPQAGGKKGICAVPGRGPLAFYLCGREFAGFWCEPTVPGDSGRRRDFPRDLITKWLVWFPH